jgi:hypothetical protein
MGLGGNAGPLPMFMKSSLPVRRHLILPLIKLGYDETKARAITLKRRLYAHTKLGLYDAAHIRMPRTQASLISAPAVTMA